MNKTNIAFSAFVLALAFTSCVSAPKKETEKTEQVIQKEEDDEQESDRKTEETSEKIELEEIETKQEEVKNHEYSFKGEESILEKLKNKDNIEFIYNSNITKLNSDNRLNSIEITNKDGSVKTIEVSGLFIAVGRVPENQNFAKTINLDESGYVIASEDCHTNKDGIFVAGDNRVKSVRQLVTATSDGAIAAIEAIKYINNNR